MVTDTDTPRDKPKDREAERKTETEAHIRPKNDRAGRKDNRGRAGDRWT